MTIRLTKTAKRAGCAAKQPPGYLFPLIGALPPLSDPNVLVGSATADDAAVYRLSDDTALVLTTDFFTPIVDDPYDFGAVASANALSDVYAMGGRPLTALNLVGFPDDALEPAVLGEILRGGAEKAREAGIDLVGGHTIKTDEPIYGLAVTGTVHPDRIVSNAGAKPGDALVLSKPLGVGIVATAAKQDRDPREAIRDAIRLMTTLNAGARDAMCEVGVHAATDVTGFGLLGHLHEMLLASGVAARVDAGAVPFIPGSVPLAREGVAAGGTRRNLEFVDPHVDWGGLDEPERLLLADAQTSGGLLIATTRPDELVAALERRGQRHAAIGTTVDGTPGRVTVSGRVGE